MILFCKTDYDECTNDPCLNGGTCVNGKRKFTCVCPRTHMGQTCEGGFDLAIISIYNCNNTIKRLQITWPAAMQIYCN